MKRTVFDPVRRQRVAETPEEGVRQQLIRMLSEKHHYPLHLMSCEYAVPLNGINYRGDVVVFDREARPLMIAECKAPGVKITTETFEQILRYNIVLKARYLLVTNGTDTFLAKTEPGLSTYEFLTTIPCYNELSQ